MCLQADDERKHSSLPSRKRKQAYEPPQCRQDLRVCMVCLMNAAAPRMPIGCGHVCCNECLVRIFVTSGCCCRLAEPVPEMQLRNWRPPVQISIHFCINLSINAIFCWDGVWPLIVKYPVSATVTVAIFRPSYRHAGTQYWLTVCQLSSCYVWPLVIVIPISLAYCHRQLRIVEA